MVLFKICIELKAEKGYREKEREFDECVEAVVAGGVSSASGDTAANSRDQPHRSRCKRCQTTSCPVSPQKKNPCYLFCIFLPFSSRIILRDVRDFRDGPVIGVLHFNHDWSASKSDGVVSCKPIGPTSH